MKKRLEWALLTLIVMILFVSCKSNSSLVNYEEPVLEVIDMSLIEFVNITEDKPLQYLMFNARGNEVEDTGDDYADAIKEIHIVDRYKSKFDKTSVYGIMDIGNGHDTAMRITLISDNLMAIDKYCYTIEGGALLKELVIEKE